MVIKLSSAIVFCVAFDLPLGLTPLLHIHLFTQPFSPSLNLSLCYIAAHVPVFFFGFHTTTQQCISYMHWLLQSQRVVDSAFSACTSSCCYLQVPEWTYIWWRCLQGICLFNNVC